jgi:hypothetical protein
MILLTQTYTQKKTFSNLSYGFNLGSDFIIREINFNINYSPGYEYIVKDISGISGTISIENQQIKTSYFNVTVSYLF